MAKVKRTEHGSFAKWRQRIKKERALVRLIVVCALLLFACVFIGAFHVNRILNTFEQTSYDYVFNRSELSSQYFSENFKRRGSLVSAEALVLAEDDDIERELQRGNLAHRLAIDSHQIDGIRQSRQENQQQTHC